MKVYVINSCMDLSRTFHEAGSTPEMDRKVDAKLWDLGLVENYDEKKHGVVNKGSSEKVAELEALVEQLENFVEKGKDTQKGHYPEGYKEYLESKAE